MPNKLETSFEIGKEYTLTLLSPASPDFANLPLKVKYLQTLDEGSHIFYQDMGKSRNYLVVGPDFVLRDKIISPRIGSPFRTYNRREIYKEFQFLKDTHSESPLINLLKELEEQNGN